MLPEIRQGQPYLYFVHCTQCRPVAPSNCRANSAVKIVTKPGLRDTKNRQSGFQLFRMEQARACEGRQGPRGATPAPTRSCPAANPGKWPFKPGGGSLQQQHRRIRYRERPDNAFHPRHITIEGSVLDHSDDLKSCVNAGFATLRARRVQQRSAASSTACWIIMTISNQSLTTDFKFGVNAEFAPVILHAQIRR